MSARAKEKAKEKLRRKEARSRMKRMPNMTTSIGSSLPEYPLPAGMDIDTAAPINTWSKGAGSHFHVRLLQTTL